MPGSRLHALIVLNDRRVADAIMFSVHEIGFEATAAYRAETAVALARSLTPDVLIVDAGLSSRNGVELAVQITTELPDCEVVLFSAQTHGASLVVDSEATNLHFKLLMKTVDSEDVLHHLAGLVRLATASEAVNRSA